MTNKISPTQTELQHSNHASGTDVPPAPASAPAHILVFGNEKGGSGKSTTAMHVAIALLQMGYTVGSIDLDARQATFTRMLKNRFDYIKRNQAHLLSPNHMAIDQSQAETRQQKEKEEREFLTLALKELCAAHDFIVIDTPGSHNHLSQLAHGLADTLITPLNDSFIDLDVLAHIDPETHEIEGPSVYTKMVRSQCEMRARDPHSLPPFRWIVMRNRLSHINARNKEDIGNILNNISNEFGCRIAPGFGERVIFKELFLKGLTLLDLLEDADNALTLSQITARQEVRNLITMLEPETYKPRPADTIDKTNDKTKNKTDE